MIRSDEDAYPVHQHLHRDHDEQHPHQPLHGNEPPLSEDTVQKRRREQEDPAHQPRNRQREQKLSFAGRRGPLQEEECCKRRRTGDERNRQRNNEGLALKRVARASALAREDHPQCDEKQDDSSGDADRLLLEAEELQQVVA